MKTNVKTIEKSMELSFNRALPIFNHFGSRYVDDNRRTITASIVIDPRYQRITPRVHLNDDARPVFLDNPLVKLQHQPRSDRLVFGLAHVLHEPVQIVQQDFRLILA